VVQLLLASLQRFFGSSAVGDHAQQLFVRVFELRSALLNPRFELIALMLAASPSSALALTSPMDVHDLTQTD